VTDHAEWLGESGVIMDEGYTSDDPEVRKRLATYRNSRVIREDGRAGDFSAMVEIMYSGMIDPDPKRVNFGPADQVADAAKTIWRRMVEIANHHDDPGRFTALIGFEWTTTPNGVNLHRVVIFRGDDVPDLPLSHYEAIYPEQLWRWLETAGGGPGNVVAITHNANASGGARFNPRYSDGRELDAEYARRRALWEPLTEVHQIKGNSETSPAVSPGDAFADFEQMETKIQLGKMSFGTAAGQKVWATVRGGLQEGLRQQEKVGVNPFQVGFTVARLAERGIMPMTDDEIRAVTVGRTVQTVNLVTGQSGTVHYSGDGNRSLIGLSDRPLVTPYEIRDGRRIETTVLGDQISVALFSVDGRILGAREDEAGFVNWEVIPQ
jgi:Protein of unknown function (DUF3604)